MPMRRLALLTLVVGTLAAGVSPRAQAPAAFTLAQVLSAPFATAMVAAPSGQKVARVFDEKGARNVWVAEGPAFTGRRLTSDTGDNGQAITSLRWTPDARTILFVRGGGPNRQGEIPNPTSDAAGAEQLIWAVDAAGGEPRKIGAGNGPVVSPKGDLVAFVVRGQVWIGGVAGTPAATQGPRTRGNARGLHWSPDGTRLAFSSARGTHAFLGVYDVAAKSITYLDASVDRDGEPSWSPDGKEIAFVRQPVNNDVPSFVAQRSAPTPWSIRIVDAASGVAREVWRAEPTR